MVQTRRDQLQAYRFQNRRALAALLTGEPNVLEPPMRRLTITTISGVMVAILIAVGFLLVGLLKPSGNTDWKAAGAVIVEKQTGATYVLIDGVLHEVTNYTSAVLAVSGSQQAHTVLVNQSDIAGAKRGPTIGIPDIPASLPPASKLISSSWTVCSRLKAASGSQLTVDVGVTIGGTAGAQALPASAAVVVTTTGTAPTSYLLYDGARLQIGSNTVAAALRLENAPSLAVGAAFLNGVPAGPPLAVPQVPGAGTPYAQPVAGQRVQIGQLLQDTGSGDDYLVLGDGVLAVDAVQSELLRTVPLAGGALVAPLEVSDTSIIGLPKSASGSGVLAQFAGLPSTLPTPSASASQSAGHGGICAVYPHDAAAPRFAVPASELPSFSSGTVLESAQSRAGLADEVTVDSASAALVRSQSGSATSFLVASPGLRYPVPSSQVLTGLGYAGVTASTVPAGLLSLLQTGSALDPTAARTPIAVR